MLKKLMEHLVFRVYGTYTHPYTLYFLTPDRRFKRTEKVEFVGSYNQAVSLAKRQIRAGRAVGVKIYTSGGHLCYEA